jgi:hypothetical protein
VQTGFSVSLAIANLGFVLGIIIIAIATIIRNQTYGIKQLLWKLVVMAILVNFGLVITAPIVGFANGMSTYFINATSPSAATGGYETYVNSLMSAFQPQVPIEAGSSGTSMSSICGSLIAQLIGGPPLNAICILSGNDPITSSESDTLWQNTMALIFDVAFSSVAAFTFLALAILLIIRYLMLGGLLIILPLAWLTYVFPKFDSSFSKWWNNFIKWTFFPPLALFFIYLAFITAVNTGNNTNTATGTTTNVYLAAALGGNSNSTNVTLEKGLTEQTGLVGKVFAQAADEVLLVGLMIMGLMFASSLAGKAGSTAVSIGASASKAVGGYIGKQTKKGARAGFRAVGGNSAVEKMRTGQLPLGLQKIPGVGRAASLIGRAAEPHLTNQALVDAAKKKVPENIEQVKQNLKGSMNSEDRFAHLSKLIEKRELTKDQMVGNQTVGQFLDTHGDMVATYGFIKNAKDADKLLGSNKEMRAAQTNIENLKKGGKDTSMAEADLEKATDDFVSKLEKGDIAKMNVNDIFKKPDASKGENPFATALAKSFATQAPQLASSAMPKMKAATLEQFTETYEKQIKSKSDKSQKLKDIDAADKNIEALQEEKNSGSTEIKRLREEIRRVGAMSGSDDHKKQQIGQRNDLIAQEVERIDARVKAEKARRKSIEDGLSREEKNLIFAAKSFRSSLNANATFGAPEPTAIPPPTPQP